VVKENNPGWAAGIGQRSPVKQLAWALKGAPMRKKDLRLNALTAVAEGRKLRDRITTLMEEKGADPNDAMVLCVFAKPDLSALVEKVLYLPVKDGAADLKMAAEQIDKLPIGFLVFVWDHEAPEEPVVGHARPLIVEDPRAVRLNSVALAAYTAQIERTLRKKRRD